MSGDIAPKRIGRGYERNLDAGPFQPTIGCFELHVRAEKRSSLNQPLRPSSVRPVVDLHQVGMDCTGYRLRQAAGHDRRIGWCGGAAEVPPVGQQHRCTGFRASAPAGTLMTDRPDWPVPEAEPLSGAAVRHLT